MATDLPGWVKSGAESARDKARLSRDLSLEDRLKASAAVCATASYMLALNPKRKRVLQWVDPVPASEDSGTSSTPSVRLQAGRAHNAAASSSVREDGETTWSSIPAFAAPEAMASW